MLEQPYLEARAFYGFFVFMCMISVYVVSNLNSKMVAIPVLVLAWNFFVFASEYGNALSAQYEMNRFYTNAVQNDLNELLCDEKESDFTLYCDNLPLCPSLKTMELTYPVVLRLAQGLCSKWAAQQQLRANYLISHEQFCKFDETPRLEITQDWTELKKTRYYTIYRSGNMIYVENDM